MAERIDRHYADAGLGGVSLTVASLPAGFNLGEGRIVDNASYRLCYNAGNSAIDQGKFATPALSGAGPASVTVSTVTNSNAHIGAVQVAHATVSTGYYFWGLVSGMSPVGAVAEAASAPTGSAFHIATDGTITLMPQSVVTGKTIKGVVITTVSNGGAYSGKVYVIGH